MISDSDGCGGYGKSADPFGSKETYERTRITSNGPDFWYVNTGEQNRFHPAFDSQTDGIVYSLIQGLRHSDYLVYYANNSSPANGHQSCFVAGFEESAKPGHDELNCGWVVLVREVGK